MEPYAAVILAGGAARRFGGADKPMLAVGGRPMLDRVLDAVQDAAERIVVGPTSLRLPPEVRRVQERPPGGGPVAAAAAGLAAVSAPVVALLAADLPFLDRSAIRTLRTRLAAAPVGEAAPVGGAASVAGAATVGGAGGTGARGPDGVGGPAGADTGYVDGVVFLDGDARRQLLCGVWWTGALRAALDRVDAPAGVPLRRLLAGLRVGEVPEATGGPPPWYDCDDPDDLRRAEEWI